MKSEELMETLLAEIEIMAKEREAAYTGNGHDGQPEAAPSKPIPTHSTSTKKDIPIIKV